MEEEEERGSFVNGSASVRRGDGPGSAPRGWWAPGVTGFLLCFAQVSFRTPFFQQIFVQVNGTAGAQAVHWCHPLIHSCFAAFSAQSPFSFLGGTTTPNLNP